MSNKLGTIEKLMDGYNPVRQRMEETKGFELTSTFTLKYFCSQIVIRS